VVMIAERKEREELWKCCRLEHACVESELDGSILRTYLHNLSAWCGLLICICTVHVQHALLTHTPLHSPSLMICLQGPASCNPFIRGSDFLFPTDLFTILLIRSGGAPRKVSGSASPSMLPGWSLARLGLTYMSTPYKHDASFLHPRRLPDIKTTLKPSCGHEAHDWFGQPKPALAIP